MKRLFVLILGIIFPVLLWAWVGSNPSVGFNYPQDGDVVSIPFTPKGWCYNTENGIDYYEIWLIEDTNDDSTINETELDNKTVIIKQENFNIERDNLFLTSRYLMKFPLLEEGKKYFLFIYAVDLNGDVSWDTNIVGLGEDGDSTRTDSCISYFTVSGKRP
ncbi:hypothetical protein J7K25_00860 [bacterium]|nr:hypothetical protein [bacterium]